MSQGVRCAAWHLTGEGDAFAGERGRPCVVMAHGFAGTADSGLFPYAERFAAAGLDVLVFDYRGFGASEGQPRQVVNTRGQVRDYAAAIAHARGLDGVDPERIALWGSSYSGGHVIAAAARDGRIAAVVSQTPSTDGLKTVGYLVKSAGLGQLARATALGLRDLAGAARGRPPLLAPAVGPPGTFAAMTAPGADEGYRAIAGETWRNEVAARVFLEVGLYRPGRRARGLRCPLLVQIAERDTTAPPAAARATAARAPAAEVREYPIDHFEIYVGAPFERSVSDQLDFLRRHLA